MSNNIHGLSNYQRAPSGPSGGFGGGSNSSQSCTEWMKEMWKSIPAFCKFIIKVSSAFYVISWVLPLIIYYGVLLPYFMINGEIWRLVSGTFTYVTLGSFFFSMFSYIPSAIREESKIGTVHFAIRFWRLSIFINLMYSLFAIAIYLIFGYAQIL